MNKINRHYVESLLGSRRKSIEIFAVAVLLAFGVSIASSGLISLFSMSAIVAASIGMALTLLVVIYLVTQLMPFAKRELTLDGILPITTANREVYEIYRYELSAALCRYFCALVAENKAIEKQWKENGIGIFAKDGQPNALICEALEYFVLNKLSLHLSAYFDSKLNIEEHTIVRIQRPDIPHLLLENRFLELFSKPMELREAFIGKKEAVIRGNTEQKVAKVVSATGKDGAIYDGFELILPTGSNLHRKAKAELQISTSRFTMSITPEFHGYSSMLPDMFETLYLAAQDKQLNPYGVQIHLRIEFKWWAFLTSSGWVYYKWLDSFLDELTAAISFEDFIAEIGWNHAVSSALAAVTLSKITSKNPDKN